MEEVGVNPNYTSSSLHTEKFNHVMGTQITKERLTAGAEDGFHVYRLEWTPDYIKTYVDGKELLNFNNDGKMMWVHGLSINHSMLSSTWLGAVIGAA